MPETPKEKEDIENQGFKVRDRRHFDAGGEARPEAEGAPGPQEAAESVAPPQASSLEKGGEEEALPAEFSSLILSLAGSAQMGMGLVPHPGTGKPEINLLQAKHAVDLLGVLEEKTKGNLSKDEAQLLEAILYELRLQFVHAKKENEKPKK